MNRKLSLARHHEEISSLTNDWEIILDSDLGVVFYSRSLRKFLVTRFEDSRQHFGHESEDMPLSDACLSCPYRKRYRDQQSIHYFSILEGINENFGSFNEGYYEHFFVEIRRLGTGGFGSVFLARHILEGFDLGEYAVKKIPLSSDDTRDYLENSLKEIRVLQALHHPNIVQYRHGWVENHCVADFGPCVPCLFVLMEYCNEGSFSDFFWDAKRERALIHLSDEEIVLFLLDITLGLDYLHKRGIVHRDVKLDNMLLHKDSETSRRRLMISDFGTYAKVGESDTPIGTLEFMAPELLLDDIAQDIITSKQDMWSVGVILFILLAERYPWRIARDDEVGNEVFDDMEATREAILQLRSEELTIQGRNENLVLLAQQLLVMKPENRPSAADIVYALQQIRIDLSHKKWDSATRTGTPGSPGQLFLPSPQMTWVSQRLGIRSDPKILTGYAIFMLWTISGFLFAFYQTMIGSGPVSAISCSNFIILALVPLRGRMFWPWAGMTLVMGLIVVKLFYEMAMMRQWAVGIFLAWIWGTVYLLCGYGIPLLQNVLGSVY